MHVSPCSGCILPFQVGLPEAQLHFASVGFHRFDSLCSCIIMQSAHPPTPTHTHTSQYRQLLTQQRTRFRFQTIERHGTGPFPSREGAHNDVALTKGIGRLAHQLLAGYVLQRSQAALPMDRQT